MNAHADSSLLLQQIVHSEALTRSLKAQFNANLPVSHLPNEILIMIFDLLSRSGYGAFFFSSDRCREWIAVTYVCSRWREVALGYPRLWTTLMVSNRRLMQLFLDRSQSLPLSLHVDHSSYERIATDGGLFSPFDQAVEAALAFGPLRMHDLRVSNKPKTYMDLLVLSPAPALTTFELTNDSNDDPVYIPNDIFGGFSPNLQTLILSNVIVSLQLHVFRCDLTALSISDIPTHLRFSTTQLLEALRHLPHLADLTLQESLPSPAGDDTRYLYHQSKLLLSCLVHLYIEGNIAECCNFLKMLWIPCHTMASIEFVDGGLDRFRDNIDVVSCIDNLLHHSCDPACNSRPAKISMMQYMEGLRFVIVVNCGSSSRFEIHFAWTDVSWLGDWMSSVYEDFMFRFLACRAAPANVRSLHLSSDKQISFLGSNWPMLLTNMSPEEMTVDGTTFIVFTTAFARIPESSEGADEHQDGLASISTLQIRSVNFRSDVALLPILIDGLLRRSAPTGPLCRLRIENCWISEEQIQQIRDLNVDLELDWDKKLRGPLSDFHDRQDKSNIEEANDTDHGTQ